MELSSFSGLAGILLFLFFPKKLSSIAGILFLSIAASFLADSGNYFFIRLVSPNGYIIGNIWYILNYLICTWLFIKLLPDHKRVILILTFVFGIGTIISFFYYSLGDSNSFIKVYSSSIFTFLSLRLYFSLLKNPSSRLRSNTVFWIANAFFIFSTVTLLRNLFLQYLVFDLEISKAGFSLIMIINLLANIAKNFILFYALLLIEKFPDSVKVSRQ